MLALRTGRYARRLAAIWCVYFLTAAVLTLAAHAGVFSFGLGVAAASTLFFVGEYWGRLRLFRGESFPGLAQQVRGLYLRGLCNSLRRVDESPERTPPPRALSE